MKAVKIAELKDHLSEHLRAVERGSEVLVTDRDRPIARIVPVEAAMALSIAEPTVPFATIRRVRHRPARWATSSLELLQRERRDR